MTAVLIHKALPARSRRSQDGHRLFKGQRNERLVMASQQDTVDTAGNSQGNGAKTDADPDSDTDANPHPKTLISEMLSPEKHIYS
jgi:hypothetical protein